MKMNIQKSFPRRIGTKTLYLMTLFTLAALAGVGFFVIPGTSTNGVVSAQESREIAPADVATAEMLRFALDFRGATGYTVFADKGISDDGKSQIKGSKGVASRDGEEGSRVRQDLSGSFNAINQLPSTKLNTLSNGSYRAGSYSAPSAKLSGELVLDGGGDQNAIFIFRVAGALRAESDFSISLVNGAEPQNVFFVTNDTATVAEGVNFRASILAMDTITVGAGAKVEGRTLSLNGEVKLTEAAVGGGTGILEICKVAGSDGLTGRVFAFRIGSLIREAPVGGCTGPITLPAGPVTIEELLDGRTLPSGTFSGRFRLIRVESSVPGSLGTVNLPLRTAVVNIREGSISNQTVVTFTNVFAVNAVVEICKRASLAMGSTTADSLDVTGFFNFTIDALPNMVFSVPVGFCSGPIQVNVPTTPGPFPAPADVLVTEIGRDGFTLESASTFPADRFNGLTLGVGIRNTEACSNLPANGAVLPAPTATGCVFANPGGGVADIDVLEGGTASQTTVNFFNRANPAILKVCKIAGPGIPEGTPFTFEVRGTAPTSATVIAPGTQITRFITVPAGPAAQGGFCDFVRETDGTFTRFAVGTRIAVVETGFTGAIPGVGPGQVRTANIRSSSGFTPVPTSVAGDVTPCVPTGTVTLTAADGGNPDLEFGAGPCDLASNFRGSATIVPSRASTVEVEFTNFVFNPTLLKICKIAGNGVAQGTPFTFNVAVTNPTSGGLNGPLFDSRLTTIAPVTVQAGPASSGGFCSFAQGPFTSTATTPPVGTFNVGSTVTITENANPGTVVVLPVTSPTGTVTPVGTNGGSLVLGFRNGFNEITFTNAVAPVVAPRAAFDFDGDGKSDPTIFRPATATWWYAASSANGAQRAAQFGLTGDQLVAADYDGDGTTDYATYRKGIWHIMGSTSGYRAEQFGMTTEDSRDIPQTGDFDGDGKADLGIYRPSTGVWYMMMSRDGFSAVRFGLDGDKPVAADFDGDRKTDAAVYRAGVWHILGSRDGYTSFKFGLGTEIDTPVAADYDGDGKADAAVFRNDGVWHLLRSRDGYASYAFGLRGDVPTPADYNGDGKTDLAVFRSGVWHMLSSGQGEAGQSYSSMNFGNSTDLAVSAK